MEKKQIRQKVLQIRQKVLKDGKIHFYEGNKKASKEALKKYFRENIDKVKPEKLTKENAQYFGQIKGGLKRAKESKYQRVNGQFIGGNYARSARRLGIDLDALIKASGEKSLSDLFKKNIELKERFDEIMKGVGLAMWFSPENTIDLIHDYRGEAIEVNGNIVSKSDAKSRVNDTEKKLFRKYETVAQALKVSYVGAKKMTITLPEEIEFENLDEAEFIEAFSEYYIIYVSGGKKKNKKNKKPI